MLDVILGFVIGVPLYIIPAIVAFYYNHYYKLPITVFNITMGWTGIGWALALMWSVWPKDKQSKINPDKS